MISPDKGAFMQTTAPDSLREPRVASPDPAGQAGSSDIPRSGGRAPRGRRRVSWTLVAFLLISVLPTAFATIWMYGFASDQYESEFRYVVRRVAPIAGSLPSGASAVQGTLPQLSMLADSEMLVQYTRSRAALEDVEATVPLNSIFALPSADWWSRWDPELAVEDRVRQWRRFIIANLDLNSGVVTVRVRAFRSEDARSVADALLIGSENLVNGLSHRAQADALALSNREVEASERALADIRRELAAFRNRNEILTPQMLGNVQAEVLARLRVSLAEARASLSAMTDNGVLATAPQAQTIRSRINALEGELEIERRQLGNLGGQPGQRESIASVLTHYAELEGNERIALQNLERALSAQSRARIEALSQGVYLNTFIRPLGAERSIHPQRNWMIFQFFLVSSACWAILCLMWTTIRDQRH